MKRKVLLAMLCLAAFVSIVACGKENTTEQQEVIATEQAAETETVEEQAKQEAETQKVETQETEIEKTADNAEDAINYDDYEELVSVPVDGRDGSQENPYQVGDTIYFPKVAVEYNSDSMEMCFSSLLVVVEEATSEYVKISYKFGTDSWEDLDWEDWGTPCLLEISRLVTPFREDSEFNQVGTQFDSENTLNDMSDIYIQEADKTQVTLYYKDYDGVGCTEDTAYLMLIYSRFSIPIEECYPYFNCTFVEVSKP